MKVLSATEATSLTVASLGFDTACTDLQTPEALAALIRKAASFSCPCPPESLARTVTRLLEPLNQSESLYEMVRDAIDQVVAYGDLIETKNNNSPRADIYLAPPSFIQTSQKRFLLFGVIPDGEDPTPPELRPNLDSVMYSRRLESSDAKLVEQAFLEAGFIQLNAESWLKCPFALPASEFVAKYDAALSNAGPPGTPEDVSIIDLSFPVDYYKGRWTKLKKQTGRFIGRRSQTFGAQLWCYLEAQDGVVTRLLDFPLYEDHWRACDEAWHLLQACDANAGHPQRFRIRQGHNKEQMVIDLYSPVPEWATRRWEAIGLRTVPSASLMSFIIPTAQVDAECSFAKQRMWLERA
jgi:hypothetical protein